MHDPQRAPRIFPRKRAVFEFDLLQIREIRQHHIHHVAAFALVEHQSLHQALQQHELPREIHVLRECDFGGTVEKERADFFSKQRAAASDHVIGDDPVGVFVLANEIFGEGLVVEVGSVRKSIVQRFLHERSQAFSVDEHALFVLAVEEFLEIVGLVDLRPAVERVVAHKRLHHLVLRHEAACAVGTLRFVHFAEPVIACVGFGDICPEMRRMDFVEWVDEEIDVALDDGDA